MGIVTKTFYYECDSCGCDVLFTGYSKARAVGVLRQKDGWTVCRDGRCYCPACADAIRQARKVYKEGSKILKFIGIKKT